MKFRHYIKVENENEVRLLIGALNDMIDSTIRHLSGISPEDTDRDAYDGLIGFMTNIGIPIDSIMATVAIEGNDSISQAFLYIATAEGLWYHQSYQDKIIEHVKAVESGDSDHMLSVTSEMLLDGLVMASKRLERLIQLGLERRDIHGFNQGDEILFEIDLVDTEISDQEFLSRKLETVLNTLADIIEEDEEDDGEIPELIN